MYTLNNHQLWSRNIYDHELMMLSMVSTNQHESNQNIFRVLGCAKIFCNSSPLWSKLLWVFTVVLFFESVYFNLEWSWSREILRLDITWKRFVYSDNLERFVYSDILERFVYLLSPGDVYVPVVNWRGLCTRCNYLLNSETSWMICSRENWM